MKLALLLVLGACYTAGPPPAPPVPVAAVGAVHTCADAAAGLEQATRALRPPESSVRGRLAERCSADQWPAAAIDCFARMSAEELEACAARLAPKPRDALLGDLSGAVGEDEAARLAVLKVRLDTLKVGIEECDRFVAAVAELLGCAQMPIEKRLALGDETADFWSLPTQGLPPEAQARMTRACGHSRDALEQQASALGCAP